MAKVFISCIFFGFLIGQTCAGDSCDIMSPSGANRVTVSTPISLHNGSDLWVPNADYITAYPNTPNSTFPVTVTATAGDGWTADPVSSPIAQHYGGSGRVSVTQVTFRKKDSDPSGKNDKSETIDVTIFVFGVSISIRSTGGDRFTPQYAPTGDVEFSKHDDYVRAAASASPNPGDSLGIANLSGSGSTYAGFAFEVDGQVTPAGLGFKPGGVESGDIAEDFKSPRQVAFAGTQRGRVYEQSGGFRPDSPSKFVSGNPSKQKNMIYDADNPGFLLGVLDARANVDGDIYVGYWNFKQHFELKGIKCSPDYNFSVRRTIQYRSGNWVEVIGGDNWLHNGFQALPVN